MAMSSTAGFFHAIIHELKVYRFSLQSLPFLEGRHQRTSDKICRNIDDTVFPDLCFFGSRLCKDSDNGRSYTSPPESTIFPNIRFSPEPDRFLPPYSHESFQDDIHTVHKNHKDRRIRQLLPHTVDCTHLSYHMIPASVPEASQYNFQTA